MAANSSSSSNSSIFLSYPCSRSKANYYIDNVIMAVRAILTLPLCTLVLYLGYQRWRQQQRSFKTTSHSDIFTYHMAAMALIWGLGYFFFLCGQYAILQELTEVGIFATSIIFYGEPLFHVLTCVERYLAVVHPITYMGLKNVRGAKIRNISIGCVWLLSFGLMGVTVLYLPEVPVIPLFCVLVFSLIVVSFCSLSVLCVLIRPGPGDGGGEKERVDQSKRRAFHTITAILGVLSLWFVGGIVSASLYTLLKRGTGVGCVILSCSNLFNLPCSLISLLLYLYRTGKLSCC